MLVGAGEQRNMKIKCLRYLAAGLFVVIFVFVADFSLSVKCCSAAEKNLYFAKEWHIWQVKEFTNLEL